MNKCANFSFVIIDDDDISNFITEKVLHMSFESPCINSYTNPVKGLEAILTSDKIGEGQIMVLFLDINMPILNGWEVLERINELPTQLKQLMKIYMFSSSVDSRDMERTSRCDIVTGYVEKPLTKEKVQQILDDLQLEASE